MNKKGLITALTKVLSTKKEAKDAVDTLFDTIRQELRLGRKVIVSGFGSFQPHVTRAKRGRNPATGEKLHIQPRKKVRFRQAKDLF
jgi:DNA-binding protein HU-beta